MQLLYLSTPWTIVLCFAGWFVLQFGAALICLKIPRRWLNSERFLFQTHHWEKNGRIYLYLGVHRWKRLLPDGAAITKGGYRKKTLTDFSPENLERFEIESCRAELTHILAILPFWVFGFIGPPLIIAYMLFYALAVNLPCIIAQRYNRPRIRVLKRQLYERRSNCKNGKPQV